MILLLCHLIMLCQAGVEHPCRVLYRTEHWTVPDYVPWGIPSSYLYLNRFAELLIHKPGQGFLPTLLATILSPVVISLLFLIKHAAYMKMNGYHVLFFHVH